MAYIAAPIITTAMTYTLDKATDLIIDRLIKAMKLPEGSTGYKILTTFKSGKRLFLRNPIVRYFIAFAIWIAYSKHIEKQADIFAAKHGYAPGGVKIFERFEQHLEETGGVDLLHPSPKKRKEYLQKFAEEPAQK